MPNSINIFQAMLALMDRQSAAILSGDFESYLSTYALPHRRLSITHDAILETREQMEVGFRTMNDSVRIAGINILYRKVAHVRRLGSHYIEALYLSHQMRDANHTITPYHGRAVVTWQNESWRLVETEDQVITHGFTLDLNAASTANPLPIRFSQNDVRLAGKCPLVEYQAHLDAIAKTEIENDFQAYLDYLRFPYTTHSLHLDNVIQGPEDARPFFDMIQKTYTGEIGDRLERRAERAEFVGPDLLVGYHTGRAYKNGVEAIRPVSSRMILQWNGRNWQLLSVANSIKNDSYPFEMYAPVDELLTDIDLQKRTRKWPSFLKKRTQTASP